ncbi:hypothetical protein [Paracoccus aminophilus]|uniref:Uncharacterized protein n=1 Tax=Paracoccus aminophilus JCM 7686 TaxID=1367847 RepID=S5Y0I6_PARAH|nr:hypothetical protein [Paracoccus aminophilus]AGT11032.1 hypothetical protein JCM7686_pAMI4p346 [Paracoccus aminophilus JCM 7686]
MSLKISTEALDEIRFEANYDTYESMLMRLDPTRFRGLGPKNREAFIRHAVKTCDTWQLHFVNDVAYVMFVMSFLGSYFHEDIRYLGLTAELETIPDGADTRIERLRSRFIALGERFIGRDMALYRRDLAYFSDKILPEARRYDAPSMLAALTASHGARSYELHSAQGSVYLQQAQAASAGLGFDGGEGLTLATAFAYWLGTGFWKDPLYPWIPEKAAQGGETAVMAYALHRLKRQLTLSEGSDG